ncbi:U6 snRNA-associated Sm-like protein LSM4, putative [Cordyceps militaris CM01]|uniref:LSM complex subunit LSM4 n=2 Tax=Cordyceps militaris TaxID=73501 RepID=G3J889_CORMM|nr:U6 snRNA-associated Sm-like protein LSM4, putative [Cordyceps militaris CM01]ATY60990.1 U6 snRNA-associated Sm [Cordyceps militaris]EGX94728.1 U6 snRNA-associated Sm-like protein LSM4, putative [Cordyceps militaris CM01]
MAGPRTRSLRASHCAVLLARLLASAFFLANALVSLQLPLGLLNAAQGHPMLVELKNGETLNGHLVNCDTWMNLTLTQVVQTSPEGDKFMRLKEVYVKGNNIKYLRVAEEIIELATEAQKNQQGNFRGGRGGQSRGDHGGRGGGDRGRGGRGGGRGGRGRGRGQ